MTAVNNRQNETLPTNETIHLSQWWPKEPLKLKDAVVVSGDWTVLCGTAGYRSPVWHQRRNSRLTGGRIVSKTGLPVLTVCEPAILIGGYYNFYHHFIDYSLAFYFVKDEHNSKILVNNGNSKFQRDIWDFFGVNSERLISVPYQTAVHVNDLTIVPRPVQGNGNVHFPAALEWARSLAIGNVAAGRRLYISRRKAKERHISNEAELVLELEKLGFETLILEDMAFKDQASAFKEAEIVVAPHGAGLAHAVFMGKGSALLELKPNMQKAAMKDDFAFRNISAGIGVHHRHLYFDGRFHERSFLVDVQEVIYSVRDLLSITGRH